MYRHLRLILIALLSLAAGHASAEGVTFCVNKVNGSVRVPKNPNNSCSKIFETQLTIPTGGGPTFDYKIGDTGPGGGIIFFVDYHDQYPDFDYLEAAEVDLVGSYRWCGSFTSVLAASGWDANAVGRGLTNTDAIIAAGCNTANDAAQAAKDYAGGGKSDWFLPSMGELMLLYTNLRQAGLGGFGYATSWSSTEYDATNAWYQSFNYGNQTTNLKASNLSVRPVRAF